MLRCVDITNQADRFIDGELGTVQKLAVLLHLAMCVKCHRFIRKMRVMLANLKTLRQETIPDPELLDRIFKKLDLPADTCTETCTCSSSGKEEPLSRADT